MIKVLLVDDQSLLRMGFRLILEAAASEGITLPLSELHRHLLERSEASGLGDLDNSAIIEIFRKPDQSPRP